MVEEVQGLLDAGLSADRLKSFGMEYREITRFLLGEKSREAMVTDLKHEIHLLAKRQETYFRGMEKRGIPIRHLEPEQASDALLQAWRTLP